MARPHSRYVSNRTAISLLVCGTDDKDGSVMIRKNKRVTSLIIVNKKTLLRRMFDRVQNFAIASRHKRIPAHIVPMNTLVISILMAMIAVTHMTTFRTMNIVVRVIVTSSLYQSELGDNARNKDTTSEYVMKNFVLTGSPPETKSIIRIPTYTINASNIALSIAVA